MSEFVEIPVNWSLNPPSILIVGDGSYAHALTHTLDGEGIETVDLLAGPVEPQDSGLPQVLRDLERVILVAGATQSAADLLHCYDAVWRWIEKLSPAGDQHEASILFVVPDPSSSTFKDAIAIDLGLESIDPSTCGHGVAHISDSLDTIIDILLKIHPMDLPPLRARRKANVRHSALQALRSTQPGTEVKLAAERVFAAFSGCEYHLDLFCRQPAHRNGNRLRSLLSEIVTDRVTLDNQQDRLKEIRDLLR